MDPANKAGEGDGNIQKPPAGAGAAAGAAGAPQANAGGTTSEDGEQPLHPAERRKLEKSVKEALAKASAHEAELKKLRDAQLSKEEQLSARVKELEPLEVELKAHREEAERRRDALFSKLPKASQERVQGTLSRLSPLDAVSMLEAMGHASAETPRSPGVTRVPPAQVKQGVPSLADLEANPELVNQLTVEQSDALAAQLGVVKRDRIF